MMMIYEIHDASYKIDYKSSFTAKHFSCSMKVVVVAHTKLDSYNTLNRYLH